MKKLIEMLQQSYDLLKEFGKFKHLFSEDEGEKILAELRHNIGQILLHTKLSEIKELAHPENKAIQSGYSAKKGCLVQIRPCAEQYKNKTYIGFYIGDVALGSSITLADESKIQLNFSSYNPAIFIPELGEIIYGCESWWGEIESIDELKEITNEDISNVWYVKLLQKINE